MKSSHAPSAEGGDLRRRAEATMEIQAASAPSVQANADSQRLLHELQVHQVELELQNEELRETRNRLETLLQRYTDLYDFAPNGYLTVLADGTIREANLTAAGLLQVERSRLLGSQLPAYVLAADRPILAATLAQVLESGSNYACEVSLGLRPAATVVRLGAALSQDGRECLVVLEDITARRVAEEERRSLEQKMLQTQKLESLGILAGGIAHDFNNLLTAILGNANLAMEEADRSTLVYGSLREIAQTARRAAELCRQMLAYAGRGRFAAEPVHLSSLVKEMAQLLHVSISKKAVLDCDLAETTPIIEADPTQLRQIVMNLVINASEAIGDREGRIRLTTGVMQCDAEYLRDCCPELEPPEPGEYAFLEVTDSGCGMTAETQARIFDPFFTTKFTGRGLGLAAVLGIARRHRGTLRVRSEPGQGTSFRVLLPTADPVRLPQKQTPPTRSRPGEGTILLVDDELPVRTIACRALERWGFRVLTAGDGQEALGLFQAHAGEIVCVLLDLTMPRMDGEQTLQELHRLQPGVKVLLTSGYGDHEATRRLLAMGHTDFIEKPFPLGALNAKLHEILARPAPPPP